MKKFFWLWLVLSGLVVLSSCNDLIAGTTESDRPYIAIVSKGFQHQFWQTVYAGSKAAAEELDVEITFEGPPSETDVAAQVEMANAALGKNPIALCLAAIDAGSLAKELDAAKASGIPVVGFDSGVPDAADGTIVSTASTNNYAAGELAAEKMFEEPSVLERIITASKDEPVSIGVLSQDDTSASIIDRTRGFVHRFKALSESTHPGAVQISGHDLFEEQAMNGYALEIKIMISATTEYTDARQSAQSMLEDTDRLIGVFCSNEGAVTGLLAATNDGTDLDREHGIRKDLIVVGFDAGISQKNAVRNQYFYGSITQDPYRIGYLAVELAYKAGRGESIEPVVDTGCKFYTYENMDDPDIAQLVYD